MWIVNCSVYKFTSSQRPASYLIQDNHKFCPSDFIMPFFCVINLNDPPKSKSQKAGSQKAGSIFLVESLFQQCCHPPNVAAPTCQCPALEHFFTAACQGALHRVIAASSGLEMLSSVFIRVLCYSSHTESSLAGISLLCLWKHSVILLLAKQLKTKHTILTEQIGNSTWEGVYGWHLPMYLAKKPNWDTHFMKKVCLLFRYVHRTHKLIKNLH